MKKIFTLTAIMCSLLFTGNLQAQGIYQWYGNSASSVLADRGNIFSMKYDGTGHKLLKEFELKHPGKPENGDKPVAVNGKLYTVFSATSFSDAFISELNPLTNNYVAKANLDSIGGSYARSAPVLYNGELYGVTIYGGIHGNGLLYKFNPVTGVLVKLYDFENGSGDSPGAGLTLFNGKLYGTARFGGNNNDGVIFEFDPAINNYTAKLHFNGNLHGTYQTSNFVEYNGLLWGITGSGGFGGSGGTLYSYNPATNSYSFKRNMGSIDLDNVSGTPVILNNKMYGCGEDAGYGGMFEYDFAGNTLTREFSFTDQTIQQQSDMVVHNNKIYGSGQVAAQGNQGVIFQYDPATNIYANKMLLNSISGYDPTCAVTLYNNRIYAWTKSGGADDDGTLIEYNPVANGYVKKVELGSDGLLLSPIATPVYYNNKLYGVMSNGGNNKSGGIYEYDPATGAYTDKYLFPENLHGNFEGCGLLLLNNKLYGTTMNGGDDGNGVLFEYDPAGNSLLIKHEFTGATGRYPYAKIMAFNGKIYGTTSLGGSNGGGVIYEFDPATSIYSLKVNLGGAFGRGPYGGLTLCNNRLYGTTTYGGTADAGVLFEYNPAINSYVVRANFTETTSGTHPSASMTLYEGKLYGVTEKPGPDNQLEGSLFQFDPVTFVLTKKHSFLTSTEYGARSAMVPMYKKLYGRTARGGANNAGTVYAYDPATGIFNNTYDCVPTTGNYGRGELMKVPAKTAPGNPGSCVDAGTININADNNNEWVPLTNEFGEAILEINAGGNNLGNVSVNYYVHNGPVRSDAGGRPYLDRNFTINVQNNPSSQVNVRFYIRKNEMDALKNTPGSNVSGIGDLGVFRNDNGCGNVLIGSAMPLLSFNTAWREDFVLNAELTSSASFYFAFRNFTVLPVNILSFTGSKEGASNKLTWKAACTNPADFTLERSIDGIAFSPITTVNATVSDCSHPFTYSDNNVSNEKYYYRLQVAELNGPVKYSSTVFINRSGELLTEMKIVPNPVSGSTANLQVNASKVQTFLLSITDATGRTVSQKNLPVNAGSTQYKLDVSNLSNGLYYLSYINEGKKITIKFIKQ